MKRILIIEDEKDIIKVVRTNLEREGFQVTDARDGRLGWAQLRQSRPHLLILDLLLPHLSGLEICQRVRSDRALSRLPILMLTARSEETDRVVGLEMGADDYVTKPFSPRELVARVKALLRRAQSPAGVAAGAVEAGQLRIEPASHRVTRAGRRIHLSKREFSLLYFMASRPNQVFTREQLLDAVWGVDGTVTPRTVDVHIRHLRNKIEAKPALPVYLKTVWGVGYMFESPQD